MIREKFVDSVVPPPERILDLIVRAEDHKEVGVDGRESLEGGGSVEASGRTGLRRTQDCAQASDRVS